jgi:hypothetical protein
MLATAEWTSVKTSTRGIQSSPGSGPTWGRTRCPSSLTSASEFGVIP